MAGPTADGDVALHLVLAGKIKVVLGGDVAHEVAQGVHGVDGTKPRNDATVGLLHMKLRRNGVGEIDAEIKHDGGADVSDIDFVCHGTSLLQAETIEGEHAAYAGIHIGLLAHRDVQGYKLDKRRLYSYDSGCER